MNSIPAFSIRLLIFSLIVALIFYFVEPVLPAKAAYKNFWVIQLVMMAITFLFHVGLIRAGEKSNQGFIRFFMGGTSLKLLLLIIIMISYSLFNRETAFAFIIHFFLFYIIYTVFEVAVIYKKFSS